MRDDDDMGPPEEQWNAALRPGGVVVPGVEETSDSDGADDGQKLGE